MLKAGRYAHARQMKRMAKEVKRVKTYLSFLPQILKELVARITGNLNQPTKEAVASA